MNNPTRNTVVASLALAALLVAGCQRGGTNSPTTTSAGNPAPASAPNAATVKNLVTPENAGKPVLKLKFGESVTFQKGGSTLVFTPKSFVKMDGEPPDLPADFDKSRDCGVWWKLSYQLTFDAQPNAAWTGWFEDFSGFNGLQKGTHGVEYSPMPESDFGSGPDSLQRVVLLALQDHDKNPSSPFHRVTDTKQYLGACKDALSGTPSGLDPLGVELPIKEVRKGEYETVIARWLL